MSSGSLGQSVDFRALFDSLDGVALWTSSEPGVFDYVSSGIADIWGRPAASVRDAPALMEGVHPEDRDRVLEALEGAAEDHTEASFEHRVVRPDGTVWWVHARIVPMQGREGESTDLVGVSTDITDQKRRERELEVLNRIVRHDIRNDMAVVLGWAEMLEGNVDERGEEYLRKILTSSEHVVELTEIAREYVEAVISEGAVVVEPTPLRSTLGTELAIRDEAFPGAAFVHDEVPDVEVAANGMLGSVFRNLLNNAVQHNDANDPAVEVICEVSDDVVVRVADDGPGVADHRKESLFGEGEKGLDSSGTGIGLYLVRTLVDQYGGDVWVEDNDPEGAVFAVRLPRAD